MPECEFLARVAAYHDREMGADDVLKFERHLSACAGCAAELQNFREISGLFGAMSPLGISDLSLAQVHEAINTEESGSGILRIGGLLAGLAASILIIGTAWLWETPAPRPPARTVVIIPSTGTWEQVAMDLRADSLPTGLWEAPDRQMLADARVADWMIDNLSQRVP